MNIDCNCYGSEERLSHHYLLRHISERNALTKRNNYLKKATVLGFSFSEAPLEILRKITDARIPNMPAWIFFYVCNRWRRESFWLGFRMTCLSMSSVPGPPLWYSEPLHSSWGNKYLRQDTMQDIRIWNPSNDLFCNNHILVLWFFWASSYFWTHSICNGEDTIFFQKMTEIVCAIRRWWVINKEATLRYCLLPVLQENTTTTRLRLIEVSSTLSISQAQSQLKLAGLVVR